MSEPSFDFSPNYGLIPPPQPPAANGPWLELAALPAEPPLPPGAQVTELSDSLLELLFGPVTEVLPADGDTDPPKLYAVLDAALIFGLPEILATSGLSHACLFSGAAAEDQGDSAPWIIELSKDAPILRSMFMSSDNTGGWREFEPGFLFRSHASLADLRAHFRKFTRVRDSKGDWLFFRFWSVTIAAGLFALGNLDKVDAFVGPFFPDTNERMLTICPTVHGIQTAWRMPGTNRPVGQPELTPEVEAHIRQIRREISYEEVIASTLRHADPLPELATDLPGHLRRHRDGLFAMGFWQKDHLAKLCVWEAMLGPNFISTYDGGEISRIIRTSGAAWIAVERIRRHLEGEPQPGEIRTAEEL